MSMMTNAIVAAISGEGNVTDWGSRGGEINVIFCDYYEYVLSITRKWKYDIAIFFC